jgi:hypothetical protein
MHKLAVMIQMRVLLIRAMMGYVLTLRLTVAKISFVILPQVAMTHAAG